jgi:Cupin domain
LRGRACHQSLAEAIVRAGGETIEHLHRASEEIYYFVAGRGRLRLGEDEREVATGDCVVIAPARGTSCGPRRTLPSCSCAPAHRPTATTTPN